MSQSPYLQTPRRKRCSGSSVTASSAMYEPYDAPNTPSRSPSIQSSVRRWSAAARQSRVSPTPQSPWLRRSKSRPYVVDPRKLIASHA